MAQTSPRALTRARSLSRADPLARRGLRFVAVCIAPRLGNKYAPGGICIPGRAALPIVWLPDRGAAPQCAGLLLCAVFVLEYRGGAAASRLGNAGGIRSSKQKNGGALCLRRLYQLVSRVNIRRGCGTPPLEPPRARWRPVYHMNFREPCMVVYRHNLDIIAPVALLQNRAPAAMPRAVCYPGGVPIQGGPCALLVPFAALSRGRGIDIPRANPRPVCGPVGAGRLDLLKFPAPILENAGRLLSQEYVSRQGRAPLPGLSFALLVRLG